VPTLPFPTPLREKPATTPEKTQWQYLDYPFIRSEINKPKHAAKMTQLGDEGWEAYAVSVSFFTHWFHFKRPL
jgi:hypothetical protein